jgi:cytochrome oxidase Cu insertion factor (SCO1/SenC/PrrC family)/Cu/Ag efflux protein CusF
VVAAPPAIVAHAQRPALRGAVVAVDGRTGYVLVRHAPFGGMPVMTMTFRLARGAPVLRAGDAVSATVNERTEPWTLGDVRVKRGPPEGARRAFIPVLHEGDAVPAVALVDQSGRPFSLQTMGGVTTIVSFIYTRCRDARMCPLVAAKFARMQRALHETPIRLVAVTLDPAYDTPKVLARYGAAYGTDPSIWTLATGTRAAIDELAGRFGVAVERPAPGTVAHTEAAIVIDAHGRVAKIVDGAAWAPDDLLATARDVAGLDANVARRISLWLGTSASALCSGSGAASLTVGAALVLLVALAAAFGLIARRAFAKDPER